jgi:uncharacterized protein
MLTDWHFYLVALPAVILIGAAKGGFSGISVLSLPLMTFVVSPIHAAAITLPILLVQDIISLWAYRKNMHRQNLITLLPGAIMGIIIAAALANIISDDIIKLMVGFIATGFVVHRWMTKTKDNDTATTPSFWRGTLWGFLGGFTSFLTNTGGPPVQIYLMPQKLPPPVYAGTFTVLFAVVNYIKFAAFFTLGQISRDNLIISAVLLPLTIASTLCGIWIVGRVDGARFYKIIYALTFVVGIILIYSGMKDMI